MNNNGTTNCYVLLLSTAYSPPVKRYAVGATCACHTLLSFFIAVQRPSSPTSCNNGLGALQRQGPPSLKKSGSLLRNPKMVSLHNLHIPTIYVGHMYRRKSFVSLPTKPTDIWRRLSWFFFLDPFLGKDSEWPREAAGVDSPGRSPFPLAGLKA